MAQTRLVEVYCIDSSVLINLKNYPKDIFPTIWQKIESLANNQQLISHIEVFREVSNGNDQISVWCKDFKKIFLDPDNSQVRILPKIRSKYDKGHWSIQIQKTGAWADPWIIALGMSRRATVVADEAYAPTKIPFVCQKLGVRCIDKFGLFRELDISY